MNIIGRITRNAEINTLANSKQVVNFSVAINDSYKKKTGERVEQTTFFNCSYWVSPNVAKILTKGTLVELIGTASSNAWLGKDGEIKSSMNFHTSKIKVHGGGTTSHQTEETSKQKAKHNENGDSKSKSNLIADDDDDLPF
ncbi:single-stranded DNA-binding protein [Chryseobacterium mulctrae]|uniref:single-stranded DNA-binding protein n=1 Tax=Chryseobacterium mulctrae TaxID=2576777 RepID=UPI0011176565|nr:single-stranded DNA-binding protein [Chryseobacterium mulctrae]